MLAVGGLLLVVSIVAIHIPTRRAMKASPAQGLVG